MEAFYQTVATLCFTLLGLWWGVVQFRHADWMGDPNWRRMAYSVQLSLIVPGAMSLGAQTAGEVKIIWRLVFVVTCGLGIVAQVYLSQAARGRTYRGWFLRNGRWLMAAVYAVIAVVAFVPEIAQSIDPKLTALQVEALLLTVVVFLSVSFVWDLLAEPRE
ncbi:MAG TPA: hypothetical protein VFF59_06190 [Anaerolineae bacterium]|nr:hypothetical protein [Anaerolineae bacterium]